MRLCLHLFVGERLSHNIIANLNLLLVHSQTAVNPQEGPEYGMAETILAALQAQKQLCTIATNSKADLEESYCNLPKIPSSRAAIVFRKMVLDLLIVSVALTAKLVTAYLQSPGSDELRSINLQAVQAKLKQVASCFSQVRKYRKNSAKTAHRRARGGTKNPVEVFIARAASDYARMEPQVLPDSVVAEDRRLVTLARNTISTGDWPKGMQVDEGLDPFMKSLLADLWTVERLDSNAPSAVANEVITLMTSASSLPTTESVWSVVRVDAGKLCEGLRSQKQSAGGQKDDGVYSSSHITQNELLLGYAEFIRDVLDTRYETGKSSMGR